MRKLDAVQQRHLRRVIGIKWSDLVSNAHVLRRANMESVEATLTAAQLKWPSHVDRMNDSLLQIKSSTVN